MTMLYYLVHMNNTYDSIRKKYVLNILSLVNP